MFTHASNFRQHALSVLVAVCLLAGFLWLRGSTGQQVQAMLDDLQEGVERGQARMLVGLLDEEYPFADLWPALLPLVERLDDIEDERDLVQRLLVQYFFQNRQVSRQLQATLHDLQPVPDQPRTYYATISITVSLDGHYPSSLRPAQVDHHRFTLRKHGRLLPRFTIVNHDPIPLR